MTHKKTSLLKLFESSCTTKLFWDVRGDAIALQRVGFAVRHIDGVVDLQLAELCQRKGAMHTQRVTYMSGLAKAVQRCLGIQPGDKKARHDEFNIWRDGSGTFNTHPFVRCRHEETRELESGWVEYAAGDVEHLQPLWRAYKSKLSKKKVRLVKRKSIHRVRQQSRGTGGPVFEGWDMPSTVME